MIGVDSHQEQDTYQLVLVRPETGIVLLENTAEAFVLPQVNIPRYTRPAEQITSAILARWNLHTVVIDWLQGNDEVYRAALEVLDNDSLPIGNRLAALPVNQLSRGLLPQTALSQLGQRLGGDCGDAGPFSRYGWVKDAKTWIRELTQNDALELGDVLQLNAGGYFSLVRFDSGSQYPAYWLKSVGVPNQHEFNTTSYLAKHCPEFLPRVIGMRSDWNAWVMEEFGRSLHHSDSLKEFKIAAVRLADLQKRLSGKADELIAAGFADQRIPTLKDHIGELIAYLEDAMAAQTSSKVAPLSPASLHEMGSALFAACDNMENLSIPDTVLHGDFSPGSILGEPQMCVFTDWCEGYVGNPFITLEQLCVHVARKTTEPVQWRAELIRVYCECWRGVLSGEQIHGALQFAPLLSVLSYLYGRGKWLASPRRHEPTFQSYARSLARHMVRILEESRAMEAICPPV